MPGEDGTGLAMAAGEELALELGLGEVAAVVCATGVDPPHAVTTSTEANRPTPTRTREE
jgi:hypothetical protein